MKKFFNKDQFVTTFLISAVLAMIGALFVAGFGFDIFFQSLQRQILFISLLWFFLGTVFYLTISILSNRFVYLQTYLTVGLRFGLILRKIFLAVFFLFPLGLIFFVQFAELTAHPVYQKYVEPVGAVLRKDGNGLFLVGFLIVWLFLVGSSFTLLRTARIGKILDGLPDFFYVILIIMIVTITRVILINSIKTEPYSDFALIQADAVRIAQGTAPQNMYIATHVALIIIYGFLYKIFGVNLVVVKVFHLVNYLLAGVFTYYMGKEVIGSRFWGGMAGLFLVSWPSLAFYSNVLTPEHPFILIECALLYAVSLFFKNREKNQGKVDWKRDLLWFLVIGFLFGLLSLFRPFSELFLVAFVITLFVYGKGLKNLVVNGAGIIVLLAVFWLFGSLPGRIAASYNNQFSNTRPCNFLVGVNFNTAGVYNPEDSSLCNKLQTHTPDKSEFTKTVIGLAIQRIRDGRDHILLFIGQKISVLWASSIMILFWAFQVPSEMGPNTIMMTIVERVNLIDFAVTFTATITCLIGVVIAFFKDVKPVIFFSLLTFFGFNFMETLFEVQTRYRTVMMPLIIFFFCWTLAKIGSFIGKHVGEETVVA